MRQRAVSLVLALVFILSLAACAPGGGTGEDRDVTVTVVHKDGSSKVFELTTDREMLGPALEAEGIVSGTKGAYGLFIETADGETADQAAQEWWCLTKGGEQVNTGVDSTPAEDGGSYELTLMTGY